MNHQTLLEQHNCDEYLGRRQRALLLTRRLTDPF